MKKIAAILFFILSINAFSQSDFRKGYIITNEGTKVSGFINYKENSSIYDSCEFKASLDRQSREYTPNLIRAYGFDNDKFFFTKEIPAKNGEVERKFLEVLISGVATLYKISGNYYLEKDEEFRELDNKIEEYIKEYITYRRPSKKYIGALKIFLKDCPNLKNKIALTEYTQKSLVRLINNYNECKGQKSIVYKNDKEWFDYNIGVSVGYSSSSKTLEGISNNLKFNKNIVPYSSITYGIFVNLMFPRTFERFSVYTGAFYESVKFHDYQEISDLNNSSISEFNSTMSQVKIPVGLRYTFPNKTITPFITVGLSNNITMDSESKFIVENKTDDIIETENFTYSSNSFNLGAWASLGIKKEIINSVFGIVEIKYDVQKSEYIIQDNPAYNHSEKINGIQILIGIEF